MKTTMIEAIERMVEDGFDLSEWETEFIESIKNRETLTEKQEICLERIYDRASAHR